MNCCAHSLFAHFTFRLKQQLERRYQQRTLEELIFIAGKIALHSMHGKLTPCCTTGLASAFTRGEWLVNFDRAPSCGRPLSHERPPPKADLEVQETCRREETAETYPLLVCAKGTLEYCPKDTEYKLWVLIGAVFSLSNAWEIFCYCWQWIRY